MKDELPPRFEQQVTFLYTADLSKTADFYESVLGLPLVLDQGTCRIYRVSADGFIGFCARADAPTTDSVIFTLVTPAVDIWHRHLCKHGIAIEKPPMLNRQYNIYHCFVRDPNGYLLEIQQFLDPTWPAPISR